MRDGQNTLTPGAGATAIADDASQEAVDAFTQDYLARLLGRPAAPADATKDGTPHRASGLTQGPATASANAAPVERRIVVEPPASPVSPAAARVVVPEPVAVVPVAVPTPKPISAAEAKAMLENLTIRLQPMREVAIETARSAILDHRTVQRKGLFVPILLVGIATLLALAWLALR